MLESAGRPEAQASNDLAGAVGLTQILAETGQNLLGMQIDVARRASGSRAGSCAATGSRPALRARRRVDERFDPAKAIAATARYLQIARQRLGRDDLAVAALPHGHRQPAERARRLRQARHPLRAALLRLDAVAPRARPTGSSPSLGDDSSTYLWRVLAAKEIMRLVPRRTRAGSPAAPCSRSRKASAEEVLHPSDRTPAFADPFALGRARASGELAPLDPPRPRPRTASASTRAMGELAEPRAPVAAPVPRAAPAGARGARGHRHRDEADLAHAPPLVVTSTVRDQRYQRVLAAREHRGDAQLLAAHDRLRVRHLARLPLARPGARVPVHARPPDGAEPDRLGARARRDPRHGRSPASCPPRSCRSSGCGRRRRSTRRPQPALDRRAGDRLGRDPELLEDLGPGRRGAEAVDRDRAVDPPLPALRDAGLDRDRRQRRAAAPTSR